MLNYVPCLTSAIFILIGAVLARNKPSLSELARLKQLLKARSAGSLILY